MKELSRVSLYKSVKQILEDNVLSKILEFDSITKYKLISILDFNINMLNGIEERFLIDSEYEFKKSSFEHYIKIMDDIKEIKSLIIEIINYIDIFIVINELVEIIPELENLLKNSLLLLEDKDLAKYYLEQLILEIKEENVLKTILIRIIDSVDNEEKLENLIPHYAYSNNYIQFDIKNILIRNYEEYNKNINVNINIDRIFSRDYNYYKMKNNNMDTVYYFYKLLNELRMKSNGVIEGIKNIININSSSLKGKFKNKVFLSHAYKDYLYALSLHIYMLNNDIFLYVDWIFNCEQVNGITLKKTLRYELEDSNQIVFLRTIASELNITDNHYVRPWCAWELGFYYSNNLSEKFYIDLYRIKTNNLHLDGLKKINYISGGKLY